jgi:protein TonB
VATSVPEPAPLPPSGDDPGAHVDKPVRRPVFSPAPAYPVEARRSRQEGRVLLLVQLDAGGEVVQVELRESSGWQLLDEAALEAVRGWRFSPTGARVTSTASQLLVPIRFSLRS